MDTNQQYIASKLFENKVLKLSGNGFEDFFSEIMKKVDNRFMQIKPQGKIGDRKNDGFIKEEGIYYQVYSPEDPSKSDAKGQKKALEDFKGLYDFWNGQCKIEKFFFVFNDKLKGVYPLIQSALLELGNEYKDVDFDFFLSSNLKEAFMKLSELDMSEIIGSIPNTNSIVLEYEALTEVLYKLMEGEVENFHEKFIVPDFDEKIKFNNLSECIGNLLKTGGQQLFQLESFFDGSGNKTYRNKIKDILKKYFEDGIEQGHQGDDLFLYLLTECQNKTSNKNSANNAIIVLIAYYFESCDLFNEPN